MKQLRKAMALLLALILALSVSAGALAAPGIGTGLRGEQNNITVVVKGVAGTPAVVYHVVIAWDALTFTYDFGEQSSMWDTTNHQYQTTTGTVGWDKTTANITITITNHSNAAVVVSATFANDTAQQQGTGGNAGVTASLSVSAPTTLGSATEHMNAYNDAEKVSYDLVVSGTPTESAADFGTITVKITAG